MIAPNKKGTKPLQKKGAVETVEAQDTRLLDFIRLANIVPGDAALPLFPDSKCLLPGTNYLNKAVKEREFARFLEENFPRSNFAAFREFLDEGSNSPFRPSEMYTKLRETREALRMIATHRKEKSLFDLNFYFPWHEVGGWRIDRIRLCDNCGIVFFANRNNKLTCSDVCSTARRVREWRKHEPQYEHARKLKLARSRKARRG